MRAALGLARRGLGGVWPNPAVGCVLVREDLDGRVVGRGWTQPGGRPHAETESLGRAGEEARGATAYISLEPCDHHGQTPPCSQSLIDSGVAKAVIAIRDPDPRVCGKGIARLNSSGIEVEEGVLEDEARRLNLGFFLKTTNKRPMFTLKLATDRFGCIPAPGEDNLVTGLLARQRGHMLRARHDGVLFGIGTVMDDDPEYTCRLPGMLSLSPVRILLDSDLRLTKTSKLMQTIDKSPLWIIAGKKGDFPGSRIIVAGEADGNGRSSPLWIAEELARRGLTRILIEAGPKVAGAFLGAGLVDRIAWFKAPRQVDGGGVAAVEAFELDSLTNGSQFAKTSVMDVGGDILECYDRL